MGQLRFRLIDHAGAEFADNGLQLRIFQGKDPIGWSGHSAMPLPAGTYDAVVYQGLNPIGSGPSYRVKVTLAPGKESVIEARFGALRYDFKKVDGKAPQKEIYVEAAFVNPDGSRTALVSESGGRNIPVSYTHLTLPTTSRV